MPEYLTCSDRASDLACHIIEWLESDIAHDQVVRGLDRLKRQVGDGGASLRAAEYIGQVLAASDATRQAA